MKKIFGLKLLTWIGIVMSAFWISFWCGYYLSRAPETSLHLNELGDFLAGVMSPLALFWLVIGYFQQGEELKLNTEALQDQQEELRRQAKAIEEQVEHFQKQAEKEDLYRLINSLIERTNKNFNSNKLDDGMSLHYLCYSTEEDPASIQNFVNSLTSPYTETSEIIKFIDSDLSFLIDLLAKHQALQSGSNESPLSYFCKNEFSDLVIFLVGTQFTYEDNVGREIINPKVKDFFAPTL